MMAHRARILKGEKTLRLHYANCKVSIRNSVYVCSYMVIYSEFKNRLIKYLRKFKILKQNHLLNYQ